MTRTAPDAADRLSGGQADRMYPLRLPIVTLGISLSAFFALSFVLCVLLGLVAQGWGMHQPWLQFFPGFVWLTPGSVLLGLAESVAYAWYVALAFGGLFNLVAAGTGGRQR
jgi:hypothetical protein